MLAGRLPGTKAHWAAPRSSRKLVGRAPSPALIGGVAEWLGRGLQNLSQRFNSAPRLNGRSIEELVCRSGTGRSPGANTRE